MTQRNKWTATRSAMFVRTNASCGSNRIPAEQLTLNPYGLRCTEAQRTEPSNKINRLCANRRAP
jgi:hypothetical protein